MFSFKYVFMAKGSVQLQFKCSCNPDNMMHSSYQNIVGLLLTDYTITFFMHILTSLDMIVNICVMFIIFCTTKWILCMVVSVSVCRDMKLMAILYIRY